MSINFVQYEPAVDDFSENNYYDYFLDDPIKIIKSSSGEQTITVPLRPITSAPSMSTSYNNPSRLMDKWLVDTPERTMTTSESTVDRLSKRGYLFLKNVEGAYHHPTPINLGDGRSQGPCGLLRPTSWFLNLLRDKRYSNNGKTFSDLGCYLMVNKAIEEDFSKRIKNRIKPAILNLMKPNEIEALMSIVWNCSDTTAASLCNFINKHGISNPSVIANRFRVYSRSNNPEYTRQRREQEIKHYMTPYNIVSIRQIGGKVKYFQND